jgi:hypothetical protein
MFPESVPAYTEYPEAPSTLFHVRAMEFEVIVPASKPEGASNHVLLCSVRDGIGVD